MVLCNVCVEMGFHFDEIFEEQLSYKFDSTDLQDGGSTPHPKELSFGSDTNKISHPRGYKHHSSYDALVRSAALGCELCRVFAYGSTHFSDPKLIPPCSERIYNTVLKAEPDGGTDPSERQIYVAGRRPRQRAPWFAGVAAVDVYFGRGMSFNAARVFCCPGDPLALEGIVVERPLFIRHARDVVSVLGTFWLKKCLEGHEKCNNRPNAVLPTRVIDVGPADGSSEPFILSPQEGTRGSWVALSHCWGGQIPQVTTALNISERENYLPLNSLPQTFIDAVWITRRLGFQYLWIDSLCILQDSISDWAHEASRMRNVYKGATVTISATMASNSATGIFGRCSLPRPIFPIPVNYRSTVLNMSGTLYFRAFQRPGGSTITHFPRGPLTERAWTVQEKVLSTRTIHFGEDEMVWDCSACIETSEDSYPNFWSFSLLEVSLQARNYEPRKTTRPFYGITNCHQELLHRWYNIICEYGVRRLTCAEDKLPAISGVAQEIAARINDTYYAGMWRQDLHRGLLWSFDGECLPSEKYIAPSWSWASVAYYPLIPRGRKIGAFGISGNRVQEVALCQPYHHIIIWLPWEKHDEHDVDILSCEVDLKGIDRYGQVSSGALTLAGRCLPAVECGIALDSEVTIPALTFRRGCVEDIFSGSESRHIYCVVDNYKHHTSDEEPQETDVITYPEIHPVPAPDWDSDSEAGSECYDSEDSCNPAHDCWKALFEASPERCLQAGSIFIQISMWSFGKMDSMSDELPVLFALLLEPTGNLGEYRRRGLARIPHADGMAVDGWEVRTVRII